jgi:hypothetical protein
LGAWEQKGGRQEWATQSWGSENNAHAAQAGAQAALVLTSFVRAADCRADDRSCKAAAAANNGIAQ